MLRLRLLVSVTLLTSLFMTSANCRQIFDLEEFERRDDLRENVQPPEGNIEELQAYSRSLTPCQLAAEEAEKPDGFVGNYVPQCDTNGNYEPLQRHGSTGYSWCVDQNGVEIPGTRTRPGQPSPNCVQLIGRSEKFDTRSEEGIDVAMRSTRYFSSCKQLLAKDPRAPSGEYSIETVRGKILNRVYCEMGLNGGGYTFLHPSDLPRLTNTELQAMFTDKSSFLMRLRKTDYTQPYGVLQQLTQYSSVPLKLGLNDYTNYAKPQNFNSLGSPFLYVGFLDRTRAANRNLQGLRVNGKSVTFRNCDANPNSYIALYPNFRELTPTNYAYNAKFPFSDTLFGSHVVNPSGRVIPEDYFMFLETHWGGCGTYTQTDGRSSARGVLGATIGFR